jgi:hypothetical protein
VHNGKFYFSLFPNSISSAVEAGKANTSILDNPAYAAARRRINTASPLFVSFFDVPKTAPDAYPILQIIHTLAETFGGPSVPGDLLPPLHTITPHLTPSLSVGWASKNGIHYRSVEPIPGSFLLGGLQGTLLTLPPMAAALLMPSMSRANEISHRAYDAASATGIAKSAIVWAADHDNNLPDHLAQLLVDGYIVPKMLVSKRLGRAPLELTPAQWDAARKDWRTIEKLVDEHCDWVYLGKGRKADIDAAEIILFEKPSAMLSDGITVGWSDAHATFERLAYIQELFKETNAKREKLKLPPVDVMKMLRENPAR